ncbi:MAG: hypothetical protein M4579_003971 [Chaenotheca gracillima]|nr:MAG: hypothetical protein M4579_003971 [Chaenotheca gracillima]
MAKDKKEKSKKDSGRRTTKPSSKPHQNSTVGRDHGAVDAGLASLFTNSAGPVKRPNNVLRQIQKPAPSPEGDEESTSIDGEEAISEDDLGAIESGVLVKNFEPDDIEQGSKVRRKRKRDEGSLEDAYMSRLAENEEGGKKRKQEEADGDSDPGDTILKGDGEDSGSEENTVGGPAGEGIGKEARMGDDIPQHESTAPSKNDVEFEKSARTVFLSNISTVAITSKTAKRALLKHLASFLENPEEGASSSATAKVESLRFRSTAFASVGLPKKAAFARKELMDATTKSTNAYAVYSNLVAAREAVRRLNGTVFLDRHLRVDSVAHPAKIDHRRCVFVGNLGFVDDDSQMNANEEERKPRKKQAPGDAEEGLWRQFAQAGPVESVRVIRDPKTRVGKGIAYVQFKDENAVEAALLFDEKKFPPLLPRKLRVTRARKFKKTALASKATVSAQSNPNAIYVPKPDPKAQSQHGRAGRLLGRAGAARFQPKGRDSMQAAGITKTPEAVVFEGYRASRGGGKSGLGGTGSGKKKGKPRNRSSKRGTAWKAAGGRKGKS